MSKRILVVDDEEVVLESVRKALRKDDFKIDTIQKAEGAMRLLESRTYDVVITDLMMPGMDGLELLQKINDLTDRKQKTIMITGYPTIKTALQAKRLGAFEYVTKPFTRQELRSVVVRAIRSRRGEVYPAGSPKSRNPSMPVYYIPEHSWVGVEPSGTVRVGMARAFAEVIGEVAELRLPEEEHLLEQGRLCAVVLAADGVEHTLHAPMSGRVLEVNQTVVDDTSLARRDPEGDGWLLRMTPEDPEKEIQELMPA
jgi:DNA-binding response OmpR family regulator